jgi:uncharacterized membrane protein YhdT
MISGETLIAVIIYLVVWGLVLYVLWWGIGRIGLPEPFGKIATVVLVLLTVVVLLNLLFGFVGQPLIQWKR